MNALFFTWLGGALNTFLWSIICSSGKRIRKDQIVFMVLYWPLLTIEALLFPEEKERS